MPCISGETYFFRDHDQFDLLQLQILPDLIKHRHKEKILRFWSAGCSSGEEAYSLAMLVDMLLPERSDWNILILGSDINQILLEKARHGRYNQWSFRMMPPLLQERYFQYSNHEWILDERIRRMVTFREVDLITKPFPNEELNNMDLILCRNVFIYFDMTTVNMVANKLSRSLNNQGYLITGHTELIGQNVHHLRSRLFPAGLVYQRAEPSFLIPIETLLTTCATLAPTRIASPPVPSLPIITPNTENLLATAHEFADRGEYDRANQICHEILISDPFAAKPYFLLAQLAQIKGDFELAFKLLNKTIYLDPTYIAAYLELSALYERDKNFPKARALKRAALDVLHTLSSDTVIEPYEKTAAEMLKNELEQPTII